MKQLLSLLALFITLNTFAEDFYKAKILLLNGETAEGFASMPSNAMLSGNVKFKTALKGKATKLKDDDIDKITYYSKTGREYIFEHASVRQISKSFGKVYDKVINKKAWILVINSHPLITYYWHAQSYYFDKEGSMVSKAADMSGTWADIFMLLKRPNEEAPAIITSISYGATVLNKESLFRKTAMLYFDGETAFNKRIDSKEFKSDEMPELINAYIAYKESQEVTKE